MTTPRWFAAPLGKRLFVVIFGVFLAAVLLELGLRVGEAIKLSRARARLKSDPDKPIPVTYDPDLEYRLTPGYGDNNSDGLRDRPVEPKNGRFRLLFLGDSVIFSGRNVDDTLVGYLRSALEQDPTVAPISVLNAGIPGYTNWQELIFLKKHGLKFKPDLVGVEFCLNDLPKVLHEFHIQDGRIVPTPWYVTPEVKATAKGWLIRLLRKSYLLMWMRYNVRLVGRTADWAVSRGYKFDYRPDLHLAWKDDRWPAIETQLREMAELGRQHGFSVFLVAFPISDQYREDYLSRDPDYVLKPQRKLKEICGRLGIPFYDLYPELQPSMFTDEIHMTRPGRQLAGRKIAAFLKQQKLVPEAPPRHNP